MPAEQSNFQKSPSKTEPLWPPKMKSELPIAAIPNSKRGGGAEDAVAHPVLFGPIREGPDGRRLCQARVDGSQLYRSFNGMPAKTQCYFSMKILF